MYVPQDKDDLIRKVLSAPYLFFLKFTFVYIFQTLKQLRFNESEDPDEVEIAAHINAHRRQVHARRAIIKVNTLIYF